MRCSLKNESSDGFLNTATVSAGWVSVRMNARPDGPLAPKMSCMGSPLCVGWFGISIICEWFGVRLVDFQTTFLCLMLCCRGHSPRYVPTIVKLKPKSILCTVCAVPSP